MQWEGQSTQGRDLYTFPFLKIPVNHFVLDELHLLLSIFDVLFDNLMALATMLDNAARVAAISM